MAPTIAPLLYGERPFYDKEDVPRTVPDTSPRIKGNQAF